MFFAVLKNGIGSRSMMKAKFFLGVLVVIILCGCSNFTENLKESGIESYRGRKIYTRLNLRTYSGNVIWYTNKYYGGILIPAGSECIIRDVERKKITFSHNGAEYILIYWLRDSDDASIKMCFDKYFVRDHALVGLDDIRAEFRESVRVGIAEIGMTKEEVLASLGYPAELGDGMRTNVYSRTFMLLQNDWYYLTGQDKKVLMRFKANRLHQIIDWSQ